MLLAKAADAFVMAAARRAVTLRISPLVVGAVVVGFGTGTPELLVSSLAAARARSTSRPATSWDRTWRTSRSCWAWLGSSPGPRRFPASFVARRPCPSPLWCSSVFWCSGACRALKEWSCWPHWPERLCFGWLSVDDHAVIAAKAFADPSAFVGRDLALASDVQSIEECRAIWRDVTGRSPRRFPLPVRLFERFSASDETTMWRWLRHNDVDLNTQPTRDIHPDRHGWSVGTAPRGAERAGTLLALEGHRSDREQEASGVIHRRSGLFYTIGVAGWRRPCTRLGPSCC